MVAKEEINCALNETPDDVAKWKIRTNARMSSNAISEQSCELLHSRIIVRDPLSILNVCHIKKLTVST
jgi:hypothetical protein